MALVVGVNSYGTVADADLYFTDRVDTQSWEDASNVLKAQALITGTAMIDMLPFVSYALSDAQTLAFPRYGTYFDKKLCRNKSLEITPLEVTYASYEQAYHLLSNDGLLDSGMKVKDLELSDVMKVTKIVGIPLYSNFAMKYLQSFIENPYLIL